MRRTVWGFVKRGGQALGGLGIARVPLVGPLCRRLFYRFRRLFTPPAADSIRVTRWDIELLVGSPLDDPDLGYGEYEVGTSRLFESMLRPGMIVVDAGANIGYYTVLGSKLVGRTGKVFAFECDPRNLEVLKRNVNHNGCDNVIILPSAVSDKDGKSLFFSNHEDSSQSSLHPVSGGVLGERVIVDTVTLDSFFSRLNWPRVDLVKLDIEGAELAALRGMGTLVSRNPGLMLIVEYAPTLLRAAGIEPGYLLEYIRDLLGLGIRVINEDGSLSPVGLLTSIFRMQGGNINLFCTALDQRSHN